MRTLAVEHAYDFSWAWKLFHLCLCRHSLDAFCWACTCLQLCMFNVCNCSAAHVQIFNFSCISGFSMVMKLHKLNGKIDFWHWELHSNFPLIIIKVCMCVDVDVLHIHEFWSVPCIVIYSCFAPWPLFLLFWSCPSQKCDLWQEKKNVVHCFLLQWGPLNMCMLSVELFTLSDELVHDFSQGCACLGLGEH